MRINTFTQTMDSDCIKYLEKDIIGDSIVSKCVGSDSDRKLACTTRTNNIDIILSNSMFEFLFVILFVMG